MFSPKTFTQALLVASIATSSLAAVVPDRDGRHEARAVSAALGKDAVGLIKAAGSKALAKGGLEVGLETAATKIKNQLKNNTARAFETQDLNARAIPNLSPEIEDLIKTSAVSGLVGGATGATINGIVNLFKDNNSTQQTRGLNALNDNDLRLLSVLSRRMLEELD
ncbi:hypothetical protein EDB87DRAFT_1576332 [Lactarius vividus]|nr:hypothetical protein EDB87DRAFT_1576332 [Lactarius vividus]